MSLRKITRAAWAAVIAGYFTCVVACWASTPAKYGSSLAACTELSATQAQAQLCCVDVAKTYGQDATFCLTPAPDAGKPQDAAQKDGAP